MRTRGKLIASAFALMFVVALFACSASAMAGPVATEAAASSGPGTAPGLVINTPAPGSYNNTGSVTLKWTVTLRPTQTWAHVTNLTEVIRVETGATVLSVNDTNNKSRILTPLPDGHYIVNVDTTYHNITGPETNTQTTSFQVYKEKPIFAISDPSNGNQTNSNNFTVEWTVPIIPLPVTYAGSLVKNGVALSSGVALGNVSSIPVTKLNTWSNLTNGTYKIFINATDAAGNTNSSNVTVFVEPFTTITTPAQGSYTKLVNGWNAVWVPHLIAGTTLNHYEVRLFNVTAGHSFAWNNSVHVNTLPITNLSGGLDLTNGSTYRLDIIIFDNNGSNSTVTSTFHIDTFSPVVNITSPAVGQVKNARNFTISWTAFDAGNPISHSIVKLGNTSGVLGSHSFPGLTADAFTVVGAPLNDGNYWVNVTSYDMAGNTGYDNNSFVLEATGPAIVISVPSYTANTNVTIGWNSHDPSGIHTLKIWLENVTGNHSFAQKVYNVAGGLYSNGTQAARNLTGGLALADGQWIVHIWANDTYGNINQVNATFYVDTVKPVVKVDTPNPMNPYINQVNFTAVWHADDASPISSYKVKLENSTGSSTGFISVGNATSAPITRFWGWENLTEGTWYLTVNATDAAGNQDQTVLQFLIDLDKPTLVVLAPVANGAGFNTQNVTFRWTASDDDSGLMAFNLTVDGGSIIGLDAEATNYTVNGLLEGNHNMTLTVFDRAGNSMTVFRTFVVDLTPPTVNITTPANNSYLKTGAVFVEWTMADVNGTIANVVVSVDGVGTSIGAVTNYTTPVFALDGWHWINVTVYDNATNTATAGVRVFVDTHAPSVVILSPGVNAYLNHFNVTGAYIGTDYWNPSSGIDHFMVKVDNGSWVNNGASDTYNFTVVGEGVHTFWVMAVDRAGNEFNTSRVFNVDTIPPVVTITNPTVGQWLAVDNVNATWTVVDASPINNYSVSIDNGATWTDVGTAQYHEFTGLAQANNTILVKAIDAAGNANQSSVTFVVDTMAPWVQFVQPSDGQIFAVSSVLVKWNVTDNVTGVQAIWIWIDGVKTANVTVASDYTFASLAEGNHTIGLQAWDNLGNAQFRNVTVLVDTIAPAIVITHPTNNQYLNVSTPTLSFTVSDGSLGSGVKENWYKVDSGSFVSLGTGNSAILSTLTNGAHSVYVKSQDNAGNVRTVQRNFTIDLVAPTVTGSSPSGAVDVTTAITVTFSEAMDHATVTVKVGSQTLSPASWSGNTAVFQPSTLSYATAYTVTVAGKDLAGNAVTGSGKSFSFTTYCKITGKVLDDKGNPIFNATVKLTHGSTLVAQGATNASGGYTLVAPAGSYNLTIQAGGKKDSTQAINPAVGSSNVVSDISMKNVDDWTWLIIVIAVIIILAIILLFLFMRRKGGAKTTAAPKKPEEKPKK